MKEKFNKSIDFKTIDEEKGQVEAVFSVFNNIDGDGDVVIPGAIKSGFKDNQVPMVFAHKWDQPIGKGTITQDDSKAVFKGNFFMNTEAGKEAYNLAKEMGDLQEWSFGFRINDYEIAPFKKDGMDEEVDVRYLKDLEVYEVSPVLVGANRETYTLSIKSGEDAVYESTNVEEIKSEPDEQSSEEACCSECKTIKAACNWSEDGGKCAKEDYEDSKENEDLEISEKDSGLQGNTFSDEVKNVLAALESLIVRAKAISILREKDGRTLSVKASSALRAVQDDLQDAWNEIDTIIDENIESEEVDVEEIDAEIETTTEAAAHDSVDTEEVTVEDDSEEIVEEIIEEVIEDVVEEDVNLEEVDEEFEALFAEAQQNITESLVADLDEDDEV